MEGFIVEGHIAGGHNAPPRDSSQFTSRGEPLYGPKDQVDLGRIQQLGKPFWPAGGYSRPERVQDALAKGAAGVQVGSLFALSRESGLQPAIRSRILKNVEAQNWDVFTDPNASPTGFPFKVLHVQETHSDNEIAQGKMEIAAQDSQTKREIAMMNRDQAFATLALQEDLTFADIQAGMLKAREASSIKQQEMGSKARVEAEKLAAKERADAVEIAAERNRTPGPVLA